jgi:hypothetical protein
MNAPSENEWQPIDTAPKDGTRILLVGHRVREIDIGHWGNGYYLGRKQGYRQTWVTNPGNMVRPTHWMPLPPPPEQQS